MWRNRVCSTAGWSGMEGLIEVGEDIVDVLDADGEADEFRRDATGGLLGVCELGVSGAGGVDGKALGVADIGEVGEEFEALDECAPSGVAPFDAEDDHGTAFAVEVFLIECEVGIVWEAWEADPLDLRVVFEVFGNSEGIFAMAFHAEREGFDAL